jgi:hypothetical protein
MSSSEAILKVVDVGQELLDERDIAGIVGLCVDLEEDPELVRMAQGSLCLRFPDQAERGVELWNDSKIQAWGRELYTHVPHLLYYMDPEPGLGALALGLSAFVVPQPVEMAPQAQVDPGVSQDLQRVLCDLLLPPALFARRMADPWEPIVDRLLDPIEGSLAAETREIVSASLVLAGNS